MSTAKQAARPSRTAAEWVAFGIALGLLLIVVGAVVREWVTDEGRPASIQVERSGPVRAENAQFYILVSVSNTGDRTAEAVQVIAELSRGDEVIEDGEQTVDFLAGGETHEVQFVFSEDPASGQLKLRAASYAKP